MDKGRDSAQPIGFKGLSDKGVNRFPVVQDSRNSSQTSVLSSYLLRGFGQSPWILLVGQNLSKAIENVQIIQNWLDIQK